MDSFIHNLTDALCRYANKPKSDTLITLISNLVKSENEGNGTIKVTEETKENLVQAYPTLFGEPNDDSPLFFLDNFVCSRRHFQEALRIASFFLGSKNDNAVMPDFPSDFFVEVDETLDIWQKVAAFACVFNRVTLITGGAGTGKTTTLLTAVDLLKKCQPDVKIVLAAPTGKAVKRMNEALGDDPHDISTLTLHQLIGIKEESAVPYFHAKRQLSCDVLVIDEASMLGHDLFSLVIAALSVNTKLILLGDENQLPPVNALPVFHPVVSQPYGFSDGFKQLFSQIFSMPFPACSVSELILNQHVKLKKTFRFDNEIALLANAVLDGNIDTLLGSEHVQLTSDVFNEIFSCFKERVSGELDVCLSNNTLPTILCVLRQGKQLASTERLNRAIDGYIKQQLDIKSTWYVGRKVIIEQNDYELSVFNGDVGVCQVAQSGHYEVVFDEMRRVEVQHLPQYSLAFAITVHKSQGSEYKDVLVAFTSYSQESGLLSKDMLYTAITRAKTSVRIFTDKSVLTYSLVNKKQNSNVLDYLLNHSEENYF